MTIRSRPRPPKQLAKAGGLTRKVRLPFGSCYVYSPHGHGRLPERSRLLCARLKNHNACWIQGCVATVREQVLRGCYPGFFGGSAVLVPVPGSQPLPPDKIGVAARLAQAMQGTGLAGSVWNGLRRATAVPRSAGAWPWYRPTVLEHLQSLSLEGVTMACAGHLVLIDDIVTKGRTLIAAAIRIHMAFPSVPIRAFAVMRTMGLSDGIQRLIEPCQGEICWNGKDADRSP